MADEAEAEGGGEARGEARGDEADEPAVLELQLGGEPTMGGTLAPQVRRSGGAAGLSYAWFRSKSQMPSTAPTYSLTALDIGHEITVRVTPLAVFGGRRGR